MSPKQSSDFSVDGSTCIHLLKNAKSKSMVWSHFSITNSHGMRRIASKFSHCLLKGKKLGLSTEDPNRNEASEAINLICTLLRRFHPNNDSVAMAIDLVTFLGYKFPQDEENCLEIQPLPFKRQRTMFVNRRSQQVWSKWSNCSKSKTRFLSEFPSRPSSKFLSRFLSRFPSRPVQIPVQILSRFLFRFPSRLLSAPVQISVQIHI